MRPIVKGAAVVALILAALAYLILAVQAIIIAAQTGQWSLAGLYSLAAMGAGSIATYIDERL